MTCKLSGLFSIGEDFDDEDLLGTDWGVRSSSGPADVASAGSSCSLRPSSVSHGQPPQDSSRHAGVAPAAPRHGSASESGSHAAAAAGQTVLGLRRPSSSSCAQPLPRTLSNCQPNSALRQNPANTGPQPCAAVDDFDDWDVDLADLDEWDRQEGQPPAPILPAPPVALPPASKALRPPTRGGIQTRPIRPQGGLGTAGQASGSFSHNTPPRMSSTPLPGSTNPRPALQSVPPHSPSVFRGLTAPSPAPSPVSRTLNRPQRPWATPGASPRGCGGLFESVSPAPANSSTLSPHPLHTTVLTNRLVQLVSASNKLPQKRPRSELQRPRTRRFPGPAGFLPQQPQDQNLDDIVVSAPQTPAHGAVARSSSQASSSQADEEEFSGGGWAAMKAEMGLDERNPSCFLHSYSVVMVLRKAALKRLARNKVPNMAVLLKSLVHTHADARAVFKDPTGEIQGTVHRRLLEAREDELKVGAVLLLKQVGVFSPSHRNHYLNVTPNNLLRIYAPDGVGPSSARLPPLVLEPMSLAGPPSAGLRGTVSRMQLVFDEEDDEEGQEGGGRSEGGECPVASRDTITGSSTGPREPAGDPAPRDWGAGWDADDDDLDDLLGELPEDTCSL
ncbi:homologous recombination OB-fold protein [Pungitius pungitius]|uniref:homologous recombination OB-fold protein n=1 Tax=Pungitius pungitius TaxID=134920 RepID=UPI002E0FCCFF